MISQVHVDRNRKSSTKIRGHMNLQKPTTASTPPVNDEPEEAELWSRKESRPDNEYVAAQTEETVKRPKLPVRKAKVKPVEMAAPGASYNPTYNDHQVRNGSPGGSVYRAPHSSFTLFSHSYIALGGITPRWCIYPSKYTSALMRGFVNRRPFLTGNRRRCFVKLSTRNRQRLMRKHDSKRNLNAMYHQGAPPSHLS